MGAKFSGVKMPRRRPVDRSAGPQSPSSQRWSTTLTADLERVAKELKGSMYYNTKSRLDELQARKLANTKTSISFGNEEVRVCLFLRPSFGLL